jgi:radical SAM protein with 4Fe4S-binding SPASM domain
MCVVTFDWEHNDAMEKVRNYAINKSMVWAVVEVTDSCNLNCIWCYANSGCKSAPRHMSLGNLKSLIKILADSGIKQITYSGGEPTLYPHIKEGVRIAKDCGMVVHMNTNGFVLVKSFAKELKRAGLSQIQTNIDSLDREKHDYIRGRKGSFDRAVRALKNGREAGLTCTSQTVLTKKNENEIIDIFRFARSLSLQRCRVWDMMPAEGCGLKNSDMRPTNYLKTLYELTQFAESTGGKHIESGEPFFPLNHKTGIKVSNISCVAMHGLLINISYTGDVYYCVTQRKSMLNVFTESEGDLKESYRTKLKAFLNSIRLPEKCLNCQLVEKCRGGCYTRCMHTENKADYWCPVA